MREYDRDERDAYRSGYNDARARWPASRLADPRQRAAYNRGYDDGERERIADDTAAHAAYRHAYDLEAKP